MNRLITPLLYLTATFCMMLFLTHSIETADLIRHKKNQINISESLVWCIERYNMLEPHISYLRNKHSIKKTRLQFSTADHSIPHGGKGIFSFLSEVTDYLRKYDLTVKSQRIETTNSHQNQIFLEASGSAENILAMYMNIEEMLFPNMLSDVHLKNGTDNNRSLDIAIRIRYDQ
ncbi:hypothetical protein [Spirochaeta dissipatitropha]